jgi:hypothetical protein
VAHDLAQRPHGQREVRGPSAAVLRQPPAAVDDRHVFVQGLRAEAAFVDARNGAQLLRDGADEDGELLALGEQCGGLAYTAEKRRRRHLAAAALGHPQRELPGEHPDHHERHRRGDVRLLPDRELVEGLGVEVGESERGAHGGPEHRCAAAAPPGCGHDQDEAHRDDDAAVPPAEEHPQPRHPRRSGRSERERGDRREQAPPEQVGSPAAR